LMRALRTGVRLVGAHNQPVPMETSFLACHTGLKRLAESEAKPKRADKRQPSGWSVLTNGGLAVVC
jgi:hypothetical protein